MPSLDYAGILYYKCEFCGADFRFEKELKKHIELVHESRVKKES